MTRYGMRCSGESSENMEVAMVMKLQENVRRPLLTELRVSSDHVSGTIDHMLRLDDIFPDHLDQIFLTKSDVVEHVYVFSRGRSLDAFVRYLKRTAYTIPWCTWKYQRHHTISVEYCMSQRAKRWFTDLHRTVIDMTMSTKKLRAQSWINLYKRALKKKKI